VTYCCDHLSDLKRALGPVFNACRSAAVAAEDEQRAAGANYVHVDAAIQNQRRCRRIRECLDEILAELPILGGDS
jgi:hypothetical protein